MWHILVEGGAILLIVGVVVIGGVTLLPDAPPADRPLVVAPLDPKP